MIDRNKKKSTSFSSFLTADYARDYINQNRPYEEQIEQAAKLIEDAEYVLIGAGAGLSTAAGAGTFFTHFHLNLDVHVRGC